MEILGRVPLLLLTLAYFPFVQAHAAPAAREEATVPEVKVQAVDLAAARTVGDAFTKPPRIMVFPRSQRKYSLFFNPLLYWPDRPLFFDRALRYPTHSFEYVTQESFQRDIAILQTYGVDGLGTLDNGIGNFVGMKCDELLGRIKPNNFLMFGALGVGWGPLDADRVEACDKQIRAEIASPYSWRLDGKVVLQSYWADNWTPIQIQELLKTLRVKNGDTFLFVCDLTSTIAKLHQAYRSGALTEAVLGDFRNTVRQYLDVCDGVLYESAHHTELVEEFKYDHHLDEAFYENVLVPALKGVLAEDAYADKLLGLCAVTGYINHWTGVTGSQDCTRRLRRSFEIAMHGTPDFMVLPEWNEMDENTHVQPTVASSLTHQRIIKYYMSQIKKETPTPNSGDDPSVPNLILSYRRVFRLGEAIQLELLNVPDSDSEESYRAQLALRDASGKLIREFPVETFTVNEMRDQTYYLPTEDLPDCRILVPTLTVENTQKRTISYDNHFLYLEIRPTWNTDYLAVKQPLRDMLTPISSSFECLDTTPDRLHGIRFRAAVESPEEIAAAEVLENRAEVFAYDRDNEFKRDGNITVHLNFLSPPGTVVPIQGKVFVRNVSSFYVRPPERPNIKITDFTVEPDGFSINLGSWGTPHEFFVSLPRPDADKAIIDFDIAQGRFTVPVKDLLRLAVVGKTFANRVVLTVSHFTRLEDIPVQPSTRKLDFTCTLFPESRNPVYHLRVITKSGKIFRSCPVLPLSETAGAQTRINVFSESKRGVVSVVTNESSIPDLVYDLDPRHGDIVSTAAGRRWFGQLGGGTIYGGPFFTASAYPATATQSAPRWVIEDGVPCLDFDGLGTFVNFPQEAFPRGSFTLSFDIQPRSERNQVLFRHFGEYVGSLTLKLRQGKLWGNFTDSSLKDTVFETGLDVSKGAWSSIRVIYDCQQMTFSVNGKSAAFPFSRPALYLGYCVFGGHCSSPFGVEADDSFFDGLLKSFRIAHRPLGKTDE